MNFRELRESRGISQANLAKLSGVLKATISQLERGIVSDPRYSTIKPLADTLGVTVEVVAKAIASTKRRAA